MEEQNMNPCEPPKERFVLWGITYHVNGINPYKGVAIVQARDAQQANRLFIANSAFNATPNDIVIEATAQMPDITESGLCIECYVSEDGETRLNYGI